MSPVMLIVDDEPDIRSTLRVYLAAHLPGVEVLEAAGGAEALAIARARDVDLLLTDYIMPEMDGLELLAHWQRLLPASKRMLITAYPDARVAVRALAQFGVSEVLAKPADPWEIAVAAARQLGMAAVPAWSGVPADSGVAA